MQKQEVLSQIDRIEQLNFWEIVKQIYPETDLSQIDISGWTLPVVAQNLERVLVQFKERATQDDFEFLPGNYSNSDVDGGQVNYVTSYLKHLYQSLLGTELLETVKSIRWLASYQVAYGFWNKSNAKVHDPKTIDLKNKAEEIEALKSKIELGLYELSQQKEELTLAYNELENFYAQKQKELEAISQARQEIQSKQNDATSVLVEINGYKSQAIAASESILINQDENKKTVKEGKTFLEEFVKEAELFKTNLGTHILGEEKRIKEIDEAHIHITDKRDFIDLKEQEIIKLASKAGDGALGHMFDKRQGRLNTYSIVWGVATGLSTVVLLAWIFIVFKYLNTNYSPEWINPLVNTIKTLPALIILIFVSKQYTKERNLQEEYAFKAAIAMTLTAYADEVARVKDDDRRIIIKETIEKVYTSPKITNESVSLFGLKQRQVDQIVDKTSEAINKVIEKK